MTGTGDTFVFEIGQVALVMLVAISSTSLSELISWLMLYRKESYKRTKGSVTPM